MIDQTLRLKVLKKSGTAEHYRKIKTVLFVEQETYCVSAVTDKNFYSHVVNSLEGQYDAVVRLELNFYMDPVLQIFKSKATKAMTDYITF